MRRGKLLLGAAIQLALAWGCGGSAVVPGDGGAAHEGGHGRDATAPPDGGATDARGADGQDAPASKDTGGKDTSSTTPYDGTTGKPCASDADCVGPGGPGNTKCSSSVFAPADDYPTAVCVLPSCGPVSGTTLHYCDGPDDPSSPGLCIPYGTTGTSSICLPRCTYDKSGDPASGCHGKDACFPYVQAPAGGVGYCWGGCTKDTDCPTGQRCQTNMGTCAPGIVPPTKPYGAPCTKKDNEDGACTCLYGSSGTGYCSSYCLVGVPSSCPMGAVCESFEFRSYGYGQENAGMAGLCATGCAGDASGSCPAGTSCTDFFAGGPDCIP